MLYEDVSLCQSVPNSYLSLPSPFSSSFSPSYSPETCACAALDSLSPTLHLRHALVAVDTLSTLVTRLTLSTTNTLPFTLFLAFASFPANFALLFPRACGPFSLLPRRQKELHLSSDSYIVPPSPFVGWKHAWTLV